MLFDVKETQERNTLNMPITIYSVMGSDGVEYAETRFEAIATMLMNHLNRTGYSAEELANK